jgi:hypothetical protein
LLAKREFIDRDLDDRCDQWSRLGECPPGLRRDSYAFRFAGFGTAEIVLYYDLVRELLHDCHKQIAARDSIDLVKETERLRRRQHVWLETPQEFLQGFSPAEVIERERQRLPLALSGEAAMVDCDCPLCQMMAESGPVFWRIDDSHMDDDVAFSLDELPADDGVWHSPVGNNHQPAATAATRSGPAADDDAREELVNHWKRALTETDLFESPPLNMFAVGAQLAELISLIKQAPSVAGAALIDTLNRDFGNLRQAVRGEDSALLEPVIACFQRNLEELDTLRPDLAAKSLGLRGKLDRWLRFLAEDETG